MNPNVGSIDRLLRITIGATLIGLAVAGKIGWWGYLGVIPLTTGIFRFCPAYTLLGFKTCSAPVVKP